MSVKLAFNLVEQFSDGNGNPYSGAKLFTYVGGSVNTKQTTYTESTGVTPNTNPIVLDSAGRLPQPVWLTAGASYKFVLAPSTDTDPPTSTIWSLDNIAGINDTSVAQSEWLTGPTPTFVSATSFTLVGDQTSTFAKSRRIKATVTAGTVYGTIVNTAFGALTTVTVALDSGNLDSGLSAVSYGIVAPVNPSISPDEVHRKGTAVASAATTDIWSIAGDYVHVTGNTGPITSFGTAPYAGAQRTVIFDSTPTITHNATTLQLPSGGNIVAAAGDRMIVRADTTANMIVVGYIAASGIPVTGVQSANTVFAGPISGAAANPAFRLLTGADGASRVLLSKKTLTGASIQFTSADFDWTAYDFYEYVIYQAVPATNGTGINVTLSENAGSTYLAGTNYSRRITARDSIGVDRSVSAEGEALWQFPETAASGISNSATNNGLDATFMLWKPSAALRHHASISNGVYFPGALANIAEFTAGLLVIGTPAALTGIKFAPSSGNWTSGTISVYGHRTA